MFENLSDKDKLLLEQYSHLSDAKVILDELDNYDLSIALSQAITEKTSRMSRILLRYIIKMHNINT